MASHLRLPPAVLALALPLLTACGGGGGGIHSPAAGLIPMASIVGNRPSEPKPSPNRRAVAMLQPGAGTSRRMNLFVLTADRPPVQVTHVEDRDLEQFQWLDDQRLAYYRQPAGDDNKRLWVVNLDGSGNRELTPASMPGVDTDLVDHEPGGTGFLRVAMGGPDGKDLYRIHPVTGECLRMEDNPDRATHYATDPDGRVLLAWAFDGQRQTLLHRDREGQPFRPLLTCTLPDYAAPVAVLEGGASACVLTNLGREHVALLHLHLPDGRLGSVLREAPGEDLLDNPLMARRVAAFPGLQRPLRTEARDEGTPYEYRKVTYPARDGLPIPAHLYLPRGQGLGRWPAVVLCHGGPVARNVAHDREAVLLATRGLVVLAPDFRGSSGYGKTFLARGFGQWGGAMQDDLVDGARWLVDQGYARADRIGIWGASYGGYAAMAGAAFNSDVFRCAVAFAGISDLIQFPESEWNQRSRNFMRLSIGDPEVQPGLLAERSPARHADRVAIPMLIGHGGRDRRVLPEESERMVRALRDRGVFVPYLLFPDEGHGFSKEENYMHYLRAVENFLGLHLGSRVEAPSLVRLTP